MAGLVPALEQAVPALDKYSKSLSQAAADAKAMSQALGYVDANRLAEDRTAIGGASGGMDSVIGSVGISGPDLSKNATGYKATRAQEAEAAMIESIVAKLKAQLGDNNFAAAIMEKWVKIMLAGNLVDDHGNQLGPTAIEDVIRKILEAFGFRNPDTASLFPTNQQGRDAANDFMQFLNGGGLAAFGNALSAYANGGLTP
jgi:hypothetical protein